MLPEDRSVGVPSSVLAEVNKQVAQVQERKKKRGSYSKSISAKEKALVAKYASVNGIAATIKHFATTKEMTLKESTVRDWKKIYLQELAKKKSTLDAGNDLTVKELPSKPQGRPPLLGRVLDQELQTVIKAMRARGTAINSHIVIGVGRGILLKRNKQLLEEYGGPITLNREWAKSVLRRMGYTKRRANSKSKVFVSEFLQRKTQYLLDIKACVQFEEIPHDMIINWDHTGINFASTSSWTMEKKGTKRVEMAAIDDKRQITGVFGCTLSGDFLPVQVIYTGKTKKCLPKYDFPPDWHITHTPNHWANEETTVDYLNSIILPYVKKKRAEHKLEDTFPALVVFDVFKGQTTSKINSILLDNNILFVHVPANCTDRLQPLDLSINKPAKEFLRMKFHNWYGQQICNQLENKTEEPVDMRISILKPVSAQWLVELYEYFKSNPKFIINGFRAAGIVDILKDG